MLQKKSRKFDSLLNCGFRKMYGFLSLDVFFFRKSLPARIRTLQKNVVSAQLVDLYPQQFAADFVDPVEGPKTRRQNMKSPALKATVWEDLCLFHPHQGNLPTKTTCPFIDSIKLCQQTSWGSPWISRATEP